MNPRRPASLKRGSMVHLVATAGTVDPKQFKLGTDFLKKRYRAEWSDDLLARDGFLAGNDVRRLDELQTAIDDSETDAIFAARGGWGTSRIIDKIDTTSLVDKPKWIVGSSDLTVLLVELWTKQRLMSIHGPMPARFQQSNPEDLEALIGLLEGERWLAPSGLVPVIAGDATGPLLGGNLTMLAHLCGRVPAGFTNGAILFLEDVGEAPYRLDRCLVQLKRSGVLENVAGVVLGNFTDCKPGSDGVTVEKVLDDHLIDLGVPIARDYPAAHGERNYPFIHGCEVRFVVSNSSVKIEEISATQ